MAAKSSILHAAQVACSFNQLTLLKNSVGNISERQPSFQASRIFLDLHRFIPSAASAFFSHPTGKFGTVEDEIAPRVVAEFEKIGGRLIARDELPRLRFS
jgi:hypothetical protein